MLTRVPVTRMLISPLIALALLHLPTPILISRRQLQTLMLTATTKMKMLTQTTRRRTLNRI